ncbi:MAG: pyridoxal-phosphate dependent enzyme, partial [Bacteroidetes bacterium]
MNTFYRCRATGATYPSSERRWRSDTGALLDLVFQPDFDPDRLAGRPATLWRYREALPLAADAQVVQLGEPVTPLADFTLDGWPVQVKLDYLYPSGSYKDRGAAVLMSQARTLGVRQVVQDSSGNAGCAVAHYAAVAGIACDIYVPAST